MPVQHKVGRRTIGQECSDFRRPFAYLGGQRRKPHLKCSVAVAVNDLAEAYLASDCCGKLQGVKRKHQLVVFHDLVGELETIGDEVGGRAPSFGVCSFYSPQARFQAVCAQANVDSNTPCRVLRICGNARRNRAVALRKHREQALEPVRVKVLVP
jgi:hypothetical protein